MKEKFTLLVAAVLLLIIKLNAVLSNIPEAEISHSQDDIVIEFQRNGSALKQCSLEIDNRNGYTTLVHRQVDALIEKTYKLYTIYGNGNECNSQPSNIYTKTNRRLDSVPAAVVNSKDTILNYNTELSRSEVITFMVAITFVKLVIVVIAYQQLLHNGYIIIQNLYHKRIRQFEHLICNRPYQLKSGRGLDEDENYLEHLKHQIDQTDGGKKEIHKQVENNVVVATEQQYSSIEKEEQPQVSAALKANNNNQLYHQQHQQIKDHNYYQQLDYNHYNHYNQYHQQNHRYYHENHQCFYQRDQQCYQGYCHQVDEQMPPNQYVPFARQTSSETLPSPSLSMKFKSPRLTTTSILKWKMAARVCNNRRPGDIPTSQQTTPVIPSLLSTICCWKMSGSRKRRKRKSNFCWEKYSYARNCNYIIWKQSCVYSYSCCCCCNDAATGFCDIFSQCTTSSAEYFHIHCYSQCDCCVFTCCCCCCYCICDSQTPVTNHLNITRSSSSSLHKTNSHQLNIRHRCIGASHHGDDDADDDDDDDVSEVHSGSNLLRSLNAVKAITSTIHNQSYKRKLKKNLVWLFIGLVWLEGPKLINCSISNNNNDVTSMSGNETTNKIGNSQSSNSDNNSGSSGSGSDARNGSRSSSNTNGPGPSPRPDSAESKGQNLKSSNLLKIKNSLGHSVTSYSKNRYTQNTISIGQPLQIKTQYKYETFYQQNRNHRREPYVVSRTTGHSSDRATTGTSTLASASVFESEDANRAQSDLVRLESIKRQILTKLGLTEKPNVTHPLPKQFIWDTIYRADGIKSASDFDFNDNHRTQEHMRLTAAVLEPPPLIPRHYPQIVNTIPDMKDIHTDQLTISRAVETNFSDKKNGVPSEKDMLDFGTKTLNLTTVEVNEHDEQMLSQYQRKHRQQHQQQRLRSNKNSNSQAKSRYSEPDYFEGDDFFGSTQEIITFAEKGKIYKKHRLVEFSPPSNKIPKQKLQIRNAEIHIRIEKVATRSSIATEQLEHHHFPRQKYTSSSKEPNLKIWIFQLIGNDFSSKGFDQVATLCTSLSVDHNVLGWQKLDITETVQFWYGKHQKDKLRLLIDCTGCGSRYILHLFDRKFHHSLLSPSSSSSLSSSSSSLSSSSSSKPLSSVKAFRPPLNKMRENKNAPRYNITSLTSKSEQVDKNQTQRYYYHYRQYNHHRYRRKNRTTPTEVLNPSDDRLKMPKEPSYWLTTTKKYRKSRGAAENPNSSHEAAAVAAAAALEGISYEVGAEYHLEDRLNPNRPFLVLHTEPSRSRRVRRRAVDCSGAMQGQCCKESFYVSFKALGWDDWIIAPRGYFANYCRGDCTGPYRTPDTFQTFHAHFIEEYRKMGLLNGMQPCCAPVKFSSMSLIYYGDDGIIKRDLPKMVVDECGCP